MNMSFDQMTPLRQMIKLASICRYQHFEIQQLLKLSAYSIKLSKCRIGYYMPLSTISHLTICNLSAYTIKLKNVDNGIYWPIQHFAIRPIVIYRHILSKC